MCSCCLLEDGDYIENIIGNKDIIKSFEMRNITSVPDGKVHGANMGPTWILSSPGGPHIGPMNLAIWDVFHPVW